MKFEDAIAAKKPNTTKVPITLDPEWADAYARAESDLRRAEDDLKLREQILETLNRTGNDEAAADTAAEIADLATARDEARAKVETMKSNADDKVITFTLRGLAGYEVDDVIADHPPTPEQKADAKKKGLGVPRWNPETYAPALVYAALIEPAWTLEQIQHIFRSTDWNVAEVAALREAADMSTMSRRVVELGEG